MLFGFFMVTIQHNNMKLEIKLGYNVSHTCLKEETVLKCAGCSTHMPIDAVIGV